MSASGDSEQPVLRPETNQPGLMAPTTKSVSPTTLRHVRFLGGEATVGQQALLVTNLHSDVNNPTILFLALTPGHLLRPRALPMGHGRQFGEFLSMGSSFIFMARPFCKGGYER